jgi:hypothetical protein
MRLGTKLRIVEYLTVLLAVLATLLGAFHAAARESDLQELRQQGEGFSRMAEEARPAVVFIKLWPWKPHPSGVGMNGP